MAKPELIQSIEQLSRKVDSLMSQLSDSQDKIRELELRNAMLEKQHLDDTATILQARKDIEFLSVSHRLAASPEALVEARQKIAALIRNIDSCIRLIIED